MQPIVIKKAEDYSKYPGDALTASSTHSGRFRNKPGPFAKISAAAVKSDDATTSINTDPFPEMEALHKSLVALSSQGVIAQENNTRYQLMFALQTRLKNEVHVLQAAVKEMDAASVLEAEADGVNAREAEDTYDHRRNDTFNALGIAPGAAMHNHWRRAGGFHDHSTDRHRQLARCQSATFDAFDAPHNQAEDIFVALHVVGAIKQTADLNEQLRRANKAIKHNRSKLGEVSGTLAQLQFDLRMATVAVKELESGIDMKLDDMAKALEADLAHASAVWETASSELCRLVRWNSRHKRCIGCVASLMSCPHIVQLPRKRFSSYSHPVCGLVLESMCILFGIEVQAFHMTSFAKKSVNAHAWCAPIESILSCPAEFLAMVNNLHKDSLTDTQFWMLKNIVDDERFTTDAVLDTMHFLEQTVKEETGEEVELVFAPLWVFVKDAAGINTDNACLDCTKVFTGLVLLARTLYDYHAAKMAMPVLTTTYSIMAQSMGHKQIEATQSWYLANDDASDAMDEIAQHMIKTIRIKAGVEILYDRITTTEEEFYTLVAEKRKLISKANHLSYKMNPHSPKMTDSLKELDRPSSLKLTNPKTLQMLLSSERLPCVCELAFQPRNTESTDPRLRLSDTDTCRQDLQYLRRVQNLLLLQAEQKTNQLIAAKIEMEQSMFELLDKQVSAARQATYSHAVLCYITEEIEHTHDAWERFCYFVLGNGLQASIEVSSVNCPPPALTMIAECMCSIFGEAQAMLDFAYAASSNHGIHLDETCERFGCFLRLPVCLYWPQAQNFLVQLLKAPTMLINFDKRKLTPDMIVRMRLYLNHWKLEKSFVQGPMLKLSAAGETFCGWIMEMVDWYSQHFNSVRFLASVQEVNAMQHTCNAKVLAAQHTFTSKDEAITLVRNKATEIVNNTVDITARIDTLEHMLTAPPLPLVGSTSAHQQPLSISTSATAAALLPTTKKKTTPPRKTKPATSKQSGKEAVKVGKVVTGVAGLAKSATQGGPGTYRQNTLTTYTQTQALPPIQTHEPLAHDVVGNTDANPEHHAHGTQAMTSTPLSPTPSLPAPSGTTVAHTHLLPAAGHTPPLPTASHTPVYESHSSAVLSEDPLAGVIRSMSQVAFSTNHYDEVKAKNKNCYVAIKRPRGLVDMGLQLDAVKNDLPVVSFVKAGSLASAAGITPGCLISCVNGARLQYSTWTATLPSALKRLFEKPTQKFIFQVEQPGARVHRADRAVHNDITNIRDAALLDSETVIMRLVHQGADIESIDPDGWTALHLAAHAGCDHAVHALLRMGADVCAKNYEMATPLHAAAESGTLATVRALVKHESSLLDQNEDGNTPLHLAVLNANTDTVAFLVQKRADVHAINKDGMTPLHLAVSLGQVADAHALLRAKYRDECNAEGRTPLHIAATLGSSECIRLLLNAGANIDYKDAKAYSPLLLAVATDLDCLRGAFTEEVRGGAGVDAHAKGGALHSANSHAMGTDAPIIGINATEATSQSSADRHVQQVNVTEATSQSSVARHEQQVDVITILLRHGATFTASDASGRGMFSFLNAMPQAEHLVSTKAIMIRHVFGFLRDAMYTDELGAYNRGVWGWENVFKAHRASWTILLEYRDEQSRTLLHWAAILGNTAATILFIQASAQLQAVDHLGNTPLHYAVLREDPALIDALLNGQGRPTSAGRASLMHDTMVATGMATADAVTKGVSGGTAENASISHMVNEKNVFGETPLHYAIMAGRVQHVMVLLSKGANSDHADGDCIFPVPYHVLQTCLFY